MSTVLPVFLLITLLLVASAEEHTHDDVGEYGYYNTWRKAMCEKDDQEMFKEMDECFKLESKSVVDATEECAKETFPASEGKVISFMNAACKDLSLFKKFDECFEEFEANSAFRTQLKITPEIEECYRKLLDKYDMDSLKDYLKDLMAE